MRPLDEFEAQWLSDWDYEPRDDGPWDEARFWVPLIYAAVGSEQRPDIEMWRTEDGQWFGYAPSQYGGYSGHRYATPWRARKQALHAKGMEQVDENEFQVDEDTAARLVEMGFKDIGGGDWAYVKTKAVNAYLWRYGPEGTGLDYRETGEWHPQICVPGGATEGPPLDNVIAAAVWIVIQAGDAQ